MTAHDIYIRDPSAVARKVAGEVVIIPVRQRVADLRSVYVLNETATWIWEHLSGGEPTGRLAADLAAEFDVTATQALEDVHDLLGTLLADGLIAAAP